MHSNTQRLKLDMIWKNTGKAIGWCILLSFSWWLILSKLQVLGQMCFLDL